MTSSSSDYNRGYQISLSGPLTALAYALMTSMNLIQHLLLIADGMVSHSFLIRSHLQLIFRMKLDNIVLTVLWPTFSTVSSNFLAKRVNSLVHIVSLQVSVRLPEKLGMTEFFPRYIYNVKIESQHPKSETLYPNSQFLQMLCAEQSNQQFVVCFDTEF